MSEGEDEKKRSKIATISSNLTVQSSKSKSEKLVSNDDLLSPSSASGLITPEGSPSFSFTANSLHRWHNHHLMPTFLMNAFLYLESIPKRYVLTSLILLSNILCYADRTNISIAVLYIPNLTNQQRGYIHSSFFYGYITTQILGGVLSAKYGGKKILMAGVILWIICDFCTVPAVWYRNSTNILLPVLLARIGMGIGEGVNFPSDHHLCSRWFIQSERPSLMTMIAAGVDTGTILSAAISPIIATYWGFEWIYYLYTTYGIFWLIIFYSFAASSPETHPHISSYERELIMKNRENPTNNDSHTIKNHLNLVNNKVVKKRKSNYGTVKKNINYPEETEQIYSNTPSTHDHDVKKTDDNNSTKVSYYSLLSSPSVWGIITCHTLYNYGFYVLLAWLPRYFTDHLKVDLSKYGFITTAMPYVGGAMGSFTSGLISEYLIHKYNIKLLHMRQIMNSIGGIGGVFCCMTISFFSPTSPIVVTFILFIGFFLYRFSNSGYWIYMLDISGNSAGTIMGISNTFATIPGIVGNIITGYILDSTNNWSVVFALAGISYFGGLILFLLLSKDKVVKFEYEIENKDKNINSTNSENNIDNFELDESANSNGMINVNNPSLNQKLEYSDFDLEKAEQELEDATEDL